MLYQEGRYQGDPVTLGVGGFGRVELVGVLPCLTLWSIDNIYKPWRRKTGSGCAKVAAGTLDKCLHLFFMLFSFFYEFLARHFDNGRNIFLFMMEKS